MGKALSFLRYCFLVSRLPPKDFAFTKRSSPVFTRIKCRFCGGTSIKTLLLSFSILTISILAVFPDSVGAATLPPQNRSGVLGTTLILSNQTEWIKRSGQAFTISLSISSSLPEKSLGLQFLFYSKLTSRYTSNASADNQEESQNIIDTSQVIPITRLRTKTLAKNRFRTNISFPISLLNSRPGHKITPTLYLSCNQSACDGVYPLQVNLIDIPTDKQLSVFTTHIIYTVFENGNLPLEVGLIIPIGENNYIKPGGTIDVPQPSISSLKSLLSLLTAYKKVPITLNISPQLVYALETDTQKSAKNIISEIRHLIGIKFKLKDLQVLGQAFSNVSATQLVNAGLGSQLGTQFQYGISTYANYLKIKTRASPYLSPTDLSAKAFSLLTDNHVNRMILPENNILLHYITTITAPLRIPLNSAAPSNKSSAKTPEVLLTDQGLAGCSRRHLKVNRLQMPEREKFRFGLDYHFAGTYVKNYVNGNLIIRADRYGDFSG